MIRVAIADNHPAMRSTLRQLLSSSKDIEIVCEAQNGQEAVDCVQHLQPDVLVMDIYMPILDGLAATQHIIELAVSTHVILISMDISSFIIRQAAAVGAQGFVPKEEAASQLLPAIETVQRGETFFIE
jgi:DNA-binding NarL/FixJ family response regulator